MTGDMNLMALIEQFGTEDKARTYLSEIIELAPPDASVHKAAREQIRLVDRLLAVKRGAIPQLGVQVDAVEGNWSDIAAKSQRVPYSIHGHLSKAKMLEGRHAAKNKVAVGRVVRIAGLI